MSFYPDSVLGRILTRLLDLFILEVLFLLTSIPVITIGAGLTAMFSVCRKLQNESVSSVTKAYFAEFRESFWKSTGAWVVITVGAFLLGISINYFGRGSGLSIVPLTVAWGLLVLVYIEFLYVFPLIAWFDNRLFSHFLNGPVLAIFQIKTTLLVTALYAFVIFLVVPILPITLLIAFSATVYYASLLFSRAFSKYNAATLPAEEDSDE